MRVAIYARLSRNPRGESTSIDRQIEACRKRMDVADSLSATYADDDTSAYSDKVRPEFERMLRDFTEGKFDIIYAYALDRLGRRPKDIERLLEAKVRFVCIRDSLDSKTASSELFIRILAAMAKMESDNTSARIRLKHDELRAKGMWSGGRTPYGWTPEQSAALREAADRLLAGDSLNTVARHLSAEPSTLRKTLLSPRMVGKRDPAGPVGMPVILDEETWRRLQRLLTDPRRRTNLRRRGYVLTPLVHCGNCGGTMHGHPRKGQRRYACKKGCGTISVNANPLEAHVQQAAWDEAWRRYHEADIPGMAARAKAEAEANSSSIQEELGALKARLYPLLDLYTDGKLSVGEWQQARSGIVQRIEDLEGQLELAQRRENEAEVGTMTVPVGTGDPRDWLTTLIERIDIAPAKVRGRRFDPSRVEITFAT